MTVTFDYEGISNDKILWFVASCHSITILYTLSSKQNHVCFRRFSVRDISHINNIQVKLIYFLVGLGLDLDFSDLLSHRPSLASVIILVGVPLPDFMLAFSCT